MKKVAWNTVKGLGFLAAGYLLWEFRTAIVLFVLSLTVAAILRPPVNFFASHGIPRGLALLITYFAIIVFMFGCGLILVGPVLNELNGLANDLPGRYEQIQNYWRNGSLIQQTMAQNSPNFNNLIQTITGGQGNDLFKNLLGLTRGSFTLLTNIFIIFVLSIYWNADEEHFKRLWLSLLPSDVRPRWRSVWQDIENVIGSYLRSELIQSLLTLLFLGIGYQLLGLKYPILLAIFGALSWLIVWFGGLIAVLLGLVAGLAISPAVGLEAALFTIIVLAFLEFFVQPRLFKSTRISSLLVIIMVLILVYQFGMIGFLIAPPLAAVIQALLLQLIKPVSKEIVDLPPPPVMQIDILKERLNTIQTLVGNRQDPPPPEMVNLIDRLRKLIERADQEEQIS